MKKAQLLSYGVMVGIAVCIACAMTERSRLPMDLLLGLGFGLLAGFYEWQKVELLRKHSRLMAGLNHAIRNRLQVIRYFRFVPPDEQERIVAAEVEAIRQELAVASVPLGSLGPAPDRKWVAVASPKRPQSQGLKSKAQRQGIS